MIFGATRQNHDPKHWAEMKRAAPIIIGLLCVAVGYVVFRHDSLVNSTRQILWEQFHGRRSLHSRLDEFTNRATASDNPEYMRRIFDNLAFAEQTMTLLAEQRTIVWRLRHPTLEEEIGSWVDWNRQFLQRLNGAQQRAQGDG